jgi:hypothetical protein
MSRRPGSWLFSFLGSPDGRTPRPDHVIRRRAGAELHQSRLGMRGLDNYPNGEKKGGPLSDGSNEGECSVDGLG